MDRPLQKEETKLIRVILEISTLASLPISIAAIVVDLIFHETPTEATELGTLNLVAAYVLLHFYDRGWHPFTKEKSRLPYLQRRGYLASLAILIGAIVMDSIIHETPKMATVVQVGTMMLGAACFLLHFQRGGYYQASLDLAIWIGGVVVVSIIYETPKWVAVVGIMMLVIPYALLHLQRRWYPFKKEKNRLYNVDSVFIEFMEDMGDYYNFTHMAIWATKQSCSLCNKCITYKYNSLHDILLSFQKTERWAFIARGTATTNGNEKHAFFIAQFNDDDFTPEVAKPNDFKGTEAKLKPLVALFTNDKNHAALSIARSFDTDVRIDEVFNLGYSEKDTKKFVYKDGLLASPEFNENEWTLMKKPMKLRKLNDFIYDEYGSNNNNNNGQHFVINLFAKLINVEYLEAKFSKVPWKDFTTIGDIYPWSHRLEEKSQKISGNEKQKN